MKWLRPSLDIVLSPYRTQFHLARCLARSKYGCNLDTVPNLFKSGDERSVGTLSKLNHAFTVPHAQVYHAKFWHSAQSMCQFRHRAFNVLSPRQIKIIEFGAVRARCLN